MKKENLRKTKIVCTMGPSTEKGDVLKQLMLAGMNVARFNFSHGDHDEQMGRLTELRRLRKELGLPVAALLDTKGPEIRLREFKEGKVDLVKGQTFTLTSEEIQGDETCLHDNLRLIDTRLSILRNSDCYPYRSDSTLLHIEHLK